MENYTLVPRFVLMDDGISDGAFRVYCLMQDYAFNNVFCFPSLEKMADDLNKSLPTIKRWVRELREGGLVKVFREHPRANNNYVLVPMEWAKGETDDEGFIQTQEEFDELIARVRIHYEEMGRKSLAVKKPSGKKRGQKSQLGYLRDVEEKVNKQDFRFSIQEIAVLFQWANMEIRNHPFDIVAGRDYTALRMAFGDKEEYGEFEMLMVIKYVGVYDTMFKSPKYPHPSTWNLKQSWIFDKVKSQVEEDMRLRAIKNEEIVDETF